MLPGFLTLSGPDGIRTRDLGLDRAACLAATPRVQERAEYTIRIFWRQGNPAPYNDGSTGVFPEGSKT